MSIGVGEASESFLLRDLLDSHSIQVLHNSSSRPIIMPIDAMKIIADRFEHSRDVNFFTSLDDREFNYGVYWSNAHKLARKWESEGMKRGDVIAFILPNNVALPCCYLSCAIGGFIACAIVDSLHPEVVKNILSSVGPGLVVRDIPLMDAGLPVPGADEFYIDIDQDAPFIMLFTSGLTGEPKTICHSLRTVVGSAQSFARLSNMSSKTRLYHILPMAYMAGFFYAMLAPLVSGASLVEGPLFSPSMAVDFWPRPIEQQVNTLSITPTIASALCRLTRNPAAIEAIKSQIVQVQCTSASIQKALRHRFEEMFSIPLQDCYGITELGGPLTFQTIEDADEGSDLSVPLPEIDVSLRGESKQKELWIRSPFCMLGYLKGGDLTRPFDPEGFMDTGDLVLRAQGRIQITGRKKDIIIRGGINISPVRVESVLSMMPDVEETAVVGVEHPFWGEEIVACIVPAHKNHQDLGTKVLQYCREHLAQHERPDRLMLMDSLPRSFIGKIQKNILRAMAASN